MAQRRELWARPGRGAVCIACAVAAHAARGHQIPVREVKPGGDGIGRHFRYIARDGVTREGEPGRPYGAETEDADTRAFEARSQGDRHQFRFIVSPEDARELGGLKDFTRAFRRRFRLVG